jgi:hypothetical protein
VERQPRNRFLRPGQSRGCEIRRAIEACPGREVRAAEIRGATGGACGETRRPEGGAAPSGGGVQIRSGRPSGPREIRAGPGFASAQARAPAVRRSVHPDPRNADRSVVERADRQGRDSSGDLQRRGLRPPGLSRCDRHAADAGGGADISRGPRSEKTDGPDRPADGTSRVRGHVGDEVERSAAGEGGVSGQSLAQCGPGLPPLAPDVGSRQPVLRPVRAGDADRERQQFPRRPREFLPRGAEQDAGGAGGGHGPCVHGDARRDLADQRPGEPGGVLLAGQLQADPRVEGGSGLLGSESGGGRRAGPAARRDQRGRGGHERSGGRPCGSPAPGPAAVLRGAAGGGVPGSNEGSHSAGPRPPRSVRRLADHAREPLVHQVYRQSHLVMADGTRARP